MNGHLFAAEYIDSFSIKTGQTKWTCLHCKMEMRTICYYSPGYPRDLRKPEGFPLTSCAEYRLHQRMERLKAFW